MKKLNKVLALALAASMVVSLAACGKDKNESAGKTASTPTPATVAKATSTPTVTPTPAPLKITVSLPSDDEHLEANEWYDKMVAAINDYTNMDVTYEWSDISTYYDDEHLGLKLSTADVADVLVVGPTDAFYKAAEEGLFWDLAPYLKDYDNLACIPETDILANTKNGKMFGIPRSRNLGRAGMGYRLDWLNKLGLDEPTTWAAYKEMLRAFTENDPDGNGLNDTVGLGLDKWDVAWDIMGLWFGVPNRWGIDSKGDLVFKINTPEYKTFLKEMKELYSKGYINNGSIEGIPDFTEINAGRAHNTLTKAEKSGASVQVLDDCRKVETSLEATYGEPDSEEDLMYTLASGVDTGLGLRTYPWGAAASNCVAISTINIKTEAQLRQVLQFLNDLNDGEMLNLIDYGFKDVTWHVTDEENKYLEMYDADTISANLNGASEKFRNGFNQILGYYTADANAREYIVAPSEAPIRVLENRLYTENLDYLVPNYGLAYESSTATYNTEGLISQLNTMVWDSLVSYVKGEIDDSGLAESISQWNKAGGAQLTKEMNELYHKAGK